MPDPDDGATVELVGLFTVVADAGVVTTGVVTTGATAVVIVVAGALTATGAALHPLIVNDEQSLDNKFFIRPNSL